MLFLAFPPSGWTQANGLHKLFSDYYEFELREDPATATFLGRNGYNDHWDDPSPEHVKDERVALQHMLRRLHSISEAGLGAEDRLSYRLFVWQLKHEIEADDTYNLYFTVNQEEGGHLNIFSTVAIEPASTVKDYEDQVARLRDLPRWVDKTIAAANLSIARKQTAPKLVAERVLDQLNLEMAGEPLKSPLLAAFTKFPASIPVPEQERLRASALDAYDNAFLPAWRKLREYIANTYLPAARDSIGLSEMPGGAAMYRSLVEYNTTTSYTPAQIHEIGLKEVARIQKEMAQIREQLHFSGTPEEFSDKVLDAPEFRYHSAEEILVHARDIAKRIDPELPLLFKTLPRMTYGVAAIPADRAATSSEYYEPPALDGSRAGYVYMRTVDPEKQSSCCMESTILHEAVPGHHLQTALSYEDPDVPDFRKLIDFTAYSEGWALYAETLGKALHLYETPYEEYGQLQGELFRAARLVVDTGIHTMGWTRQQAIDYMYDSGANDSRDFIASEVDRYIAWPGQALAYKIGQMKILELRSLAEKELGPKFDIRDFHDAVLRNGSVPLDILEEQIRAWISQKLKSASKEQK
ncbi:MAG: DUF885 domain-containing protein [Candidatus Acidiferrales bacterium]